MPVRFITKEEMLNLEKIMAVAFVQTLDIKKFEEEIKTKDAPEKRHIAYVNDAGEMTAGMVLPEFDMWLNGTLVKMVGIGGVASLPEHRHERAIRKCFDFAFRDMIESGVAFSSLYPFSHTFYRKFGYEFISPALEYTLPTISLSKQYRHDGWARMYEKPAPLSEYRRVFEACYSHYNGAVRRDDELWLHSRLTADPYAEKLYTYLLGDENGPNAYFTFAAEKSGAFDNVLNVVEIAYLTPSALLSTLGFIGRLSAQYSKTKLCLPEDVPLHHLIDESYEVEMNVKNQVMFRVVSAETALKALRHPIGAEYTLSIRDDGIPENDGAFRVIADESCVRVERFEGDSCDLSLDIRTLAPLVMGGLSLKQAAFRPDVKIGGNVQTLEAVFTKRPFHLTEAF